MHLKGKYFVFEIILQPFCQNLICTITIERQTSSICNFIIFTYFFCYFYTIFIALLDSLSKKTERKVKVKQTKNHKNFRNRFIFISFFFLVKKNLFF